MLGGVGLAALAFGAYRLLRVAPEHEREQAAGPAPEIAAPVLSPRPAPEPVRSSPPPVRSAPVPAAPSPAVPSEPFELVLQPQRIVIEAREVLLELELLVGNRQASAAEAIRVQIVPLSANPDQDRQLAGFHASPLADQAGPPFDLPAGKGGRLPLRVALPRERLHVVEVGGRPMFVPMVLIDLRWRTGISIRRWGADFMLGTPGQGGKLGPIWLDRAPAGPLAATRYAPRARAAA